MSNIPSKNRMSARPPATSTDAAADFISGAETSAPRTRVLPKSDLPWEADYVREDVIKSVNLRLPEPYILKLKYLSEQTHKSQQTLIRDILCPEIDRIIKEL